MSDPNFYIDGAKRMSAEGIEAVSKIMAFMKQNEDGLKNLSPSDRKKAILEFEPSKLFNQVHPIVFQYLVIEGVFNANAFRRYVTSVFGKPKSKEDQEKMKEDRKYVYHFKNRQMAIYYKYLLIETNPNVNKNTIHKMYEDMVASLNAETDRMMDAYDRAEKDAKALEAGLDAEKRNDLIELLKKRVSGP